VRQLVHVLAIAVLLPLTGVSAAPADWDAGSRDTHTLSAPPGDATTGVFGRTGAPHGGGLPLAWPASIASALCVAAFHASARSTHPHARTRWCMGHSSSTAIS